MLRLAATRPQLLADHAGAWVDLLQAECGPAVAILRRRWLLQAAACVSALIAVILGGVSLMMWAALFAQQPASTLTAAVLWGVPLVPLILAVCCALLARAGGAEAADGGPFGALGRQFQADLALLRQAAESPT
ncbi:MAG: hypothetical protein Q8R98_09845 [Rubrivivax sp.]|nr:hypothetical protein [Rubrivivax sp.]